MAQERVPHPDNPVILSGFWLAAARAAWVILVLAGVLPTLFNIPAYYNQVIDFSAAGGDGAFTNWTAEALRAAAGSLGISSTGLAVYVVANTLLTFFIFAGVGLIIFIRRSDQLIGLLTAFLFCTLGLGIGSGIRPNLAGLSPEAAAIYSQIAGFIWAFFFIFFTLFPDGRFVPRWTRWLPPVWVVAYLVVNVPALEPVSRVMFMVLFLISLGSQFYRYRWSAGRRERQQIRWFAAATAAFGLYWFPVFLLNNLPGTIVPALAHLGPARLMYDLISQGIGALVSSLLPISIAIALLRYRLWDLDFIIRRTLLYALLSGLLGLVYFGSVLLLRQLLGGIAGESAAALVISTLLIASLFNPLRRRLQTGIDRRFFRQKYDDALLLEGFSAAVRNEVELDALTGSLAAVVSAAIQPQSISLWIKTPAQSQSSRQATAGEGLSRNEGSKDKVFS